MKTAVIILSLIVAVLLWLLYDTRTTYSENLENEMKAKEYHQSRADSIGTLYETLLKEDTVQAILYRNAVERGDRAIERVLKLNQELQRERAFNRKFNDFETDSLLSLVR